MFKSLKISILYANVVAFRIVFCNCWLCPKPTNYKTANTNSGRRQHLVVCNTFYFSACTSGCYSLDVEKKKRGE